MADMSDIFSMFMGGGMGGAGMPGGGARRGRGRGGAGAGQDPFGGMNFGQ